MDDPFDWDVDRVVLELCSLDRACFGISSPELPPSDQLEACLRKQGADGHTILTYPDESELCDSLGIRTLKHKNTFKHARSQLRQRSQMYQHYLNNPIAPEDARPESLIMPIHSSVAPVTALAPTPAPATTIHVPNNPSDHKTRRVAPVPAPTEINTQPRTRTVDKTRPASQSDRDDLGIQERAPLKPQTDVAVEKRIKRAYAYGPTGDNIDLQDRLATVARKDGTNLHTTKRKNEEDHDQHRAKRPKQEIEVIELSDDDNNDSHSSTQEPEPVHSVSDSYSSRKLDTEFGGRYANRHITNADWARVYKIFQYPAFTTSLKPPGFSIKIAAYQLHAI
ncbi:hypothetical protein F4803DRAFT_525420 [Xylaria telfairii]|nr:hypothetical protein F4803DRAFT_525420 [Xylaria telfairii]